MNFIEDMADLVERGLVAEGIAIEPEVKANPVILLARSVAYSMRSIQPRKWKVRLSQALLASAEYAQFSAPVQNLKQIAEAGGNLQPYQSKKIDEFEFREYMLFDWGVQHLHLGEHLPGKKFAERSGPLLFAMFRGEEAYFIGIFGHSWAELDILNIIDAEWPELIEGHVIRGFDDIGPIPTAEETLKLRKAGINPLQKLSSGKILSSPGGGITTNSTSAQAMIDAQQLVHLLRAIEKEVSDNLNEYHATLRSNPGERIRLLRFDQKKRVARVGVNAGVAVCDISF